MLQWLVDVVRTRGLYCMSVADLAPYSDRTRRLVRRNAKPPRTLAALDSSVLCVGPELYFDLKPKVF